MDDQECAVQTPPSVIRSVFFDHTSEGQALSKSVPYFEITVEKFDEPSADNFEKSMQDVYRSGRNFIVIHVHSPGGQVFALNRMLSCIAEAKRQGITIVTTCRGYAASCGSILLAMGTPGYRYCGDNGVVLIHNISAGSTGTLCKLTYDVVSDLANNRALFRQIAINADIDNKNFYSDFLNDSSKDQWIHPYTAKRLRIVDHVGHPVIIKKSDTSYDIDPGRKDISDEETEERSRIEQGEVYQLRDTISALPSPKLKTHKRPDITMPGRGRSSTTSILPPTMEVVMEQTTIQETAGGWGTKVKW